jgi:nucleotide-binding universal stress UspA family protein
MFQRIVVPLDGSTRAERAVPVAARLARPAHGTLIFTRAVLPPMDYSKCASRHSAIWERNLHEKQRAEATSYLVKAMLAHTGDLQGIDSELGVATGIIPQAICSVARSEHAHLIVICSRGETGLKRRFFGSVALEVVRHSSVPVLVLHEQGKAMPVSQLACPVRAIVALDGSTLSESALEPAAHLIAALAAPGQATLQLLRVVDPLASEGKWRSHTHVDISKQIQARNAAETYLRTVAERLRHGSLAALNLLVTSSVVSSPDVVGTIIQQAENGKWNGQVGECALIALALHEHTGLRHLSMGHVTRRAFEATKLPLLLVRPQPTTVQRPEKII